ncbi:MAG: hypothetical protein GSR80_000394 [Desulfurococcales archaeon]|nr:hypothetical protein [Desulfurococcales archaeon]
MLGVFRYRDKLGHRLVLILRGFPCSWGRCTFCPFALEQSTSTARVIGDNRRIIERAIEEIRREPVGRVAVFNGGSFHELPYDTVERLRPLARGRVFEVEERSEFVTLDSLEALVDYYRPRRLIVRVGFETAFEDIREGLLRKGMPDSEMHRLSRLRLEARSRGLPVEIWTYLLFGMEGIPEETVVESLRAFKRLFDGVIAVRYVKYLPSHPDPAPVSEALAKTLEEEADLVDWGGEQWEIAGRRGSAPGASGAARSSTGSGERRGST